MQTRLWYFFLCLSVFQNYLNPQMRPIKSKFWPKINFFTKIMKNQQIWIFFHVSIDQSSLWAINYLVYEFYDHTTHFEDNMRFWIWKKKRKKNIIIFSITSKYLKYNAKKIIIISKKNYNNFNFHNFKISRFPQN
jgi:hypothetical protein